MQKFPNLKIIEHPLISHRLTIIRNKNTNSELFRINLKKICEILVTEATKNLPLKEVEIETPISKTKSKILKDDIEIIGVFILRAGLIFSSIFEENIPNVKIQHLGMGRDEITKKPVWYYNKIPEKFDLSKEHYIYICDPMLATGGSAIDAIKVYVNDKKIPQKNIVFINLVCSIEGLERVFSLFPDIHIISAALDEKLNDDKFIVPGLGDAGDRIFNSFY